MAPLRKDIGSDADSPRKTSPDVSAADTFPCKAYQVIQHCEMNDPDVACWSDDGSHFVVKDTGVFSSNHLPRYFKHSNFQSFNRQLNIYGFRTVKEHDNRDGSIAFRHQFFQRERYDLLPNITNTRSNKKRNESYNDRFDEMQQQLDVMSEKLDLLISLVKANNGLSQAEALVNPSHIPLGAKRRRRSDDVMPVQKEEDANQSENEPQVPSTKSTQRMVLDAMMKHQQNLTNEPVAHKARQQTAEDSKAGRLKAEALRKGTNQKLTGPYRRSLVVLGQKMEPLARTLGGPDPQNGEFSQVSDITAAARAESFLSESSGRKAGFSTFFAGAEQGPNEQDVLERLRESTQDIAVLKEGEDYDFNMFIDEVLGEGEEEGSDAVSGLVRQDMVQFCSTDLVDVEKVLNSNSIENNESTTTMAADHLMSKVTPERVQWQIRIPTIQEQYIAESKGAASCFSNYDDEYDAKGGGCTPHHGLWTSG